MRAGATLLGGSSSYVRLAGSGSYCDDPKRANSISCKWRGKTPTSSGASKPSTPLASSSSFFGPRSTYSPIPSTPVITNPAAPPPPVAPAPTPVTPPAPTPIEVPTCATDWTAAAAEVRRIAQAVRSCETPSASLPAAISPCATGSGSGTCSYDDYLRAREEFAAAQDDAVLCSSGDTGSSGGSISPGGSGSTVIPSPGYSNYYSKDEEEAPLVEPDTSPIFSRGAKVGAGIGGLVVAAIVAVALLRGKRTRRSSRRA